LPIHPYALFHYRTSNIGDDTQSYATALHLPHIDAFVDRDNLAGLILPQPHRCVMNSWFFLGADQGPPSEAIAPIFHGISIGRAGMLRGAWREYLAAHAPIGCRDRRSVEMLHAAGIDAYWSGCLTLMIGQAFEPVPPEARRGVYIVDVHPDVEALRVPPEISARATRWSNEFDPLIAGSTGRRFAKVHELMHRLAHAELVITRRLHIALPCAGFGTPVLTLPNPGISDARHRFSGYEQFLPVVWPEDKTVPFDFTAPKSAEIPAELNAAFADLRGKLDAAPVRRSWSADTRLLRDAEGIVPRTGRIGLKIGGDVDVYPATLNADGKQVLLIDGIPFAEKLGGQVIAAPEGPESAMAAMDEFSVRRVVELIAKQLANEVDVLSLDRRMRELAQGPLFDAVLRFWAPTLREGRWRDLEADWRRAAVAFGTDSYETGRLVDVLWRAGDADAARVAIAQMRHALAAQPFTVHGDDFHRGKNIEILDGFEALLAFDAGACAADDARLANLHPFVVASIYDVMWDAHAAGEQARACALGLLYIRATAPYGHGPETALWIVAHILAPLSAHRDALEVLAGLSMTGATAGHHWRHLTLTAASARECDDAETHAAAVEALAPLFADAPMDAILDDAAWSDAYLRAAGLVDAHAPGFAVAVRERLAPFEHDARARRLSARLALEALAHAPAESALALARQVAQAPPDTLTDASLKAVDVLAAAGEWVAAAAIYAAGIEPNWDAPGAVGGAWRRKGLTGAASLPASGWVWSGRGIGDDVLRLKALVALKGREACARYDLDPRLAPLAARALPAIHFDHTPRAIGPGAVGRSAFWKARNGVPRAFDAFRVTADRLDFLRRGRPVLQSEDILCAYLQNAGVLTRDAGPILEPSAGAFARIAPWLAPAEGVRLTLCLAWRSGLLDRERRRFFFELEELAPLWASPDVRWIVVQHDLTDAERALIARTPELVLPPELDTRNDFDTLCALFRRCDGVVAPKLSTRDIAAAAGARVLSLSIGHRDIEGARIAEDGAIDRIFPNIHHVRARNGLDRAGVIRAAAEIVRRWAPLTPPA